MNPFPHLNRPFNPPPYLVDPSRPKGEGYVPVIITRGISPRSDYVAAIERMWSEPRRRLAEELRAHGEELENAHWDWRNKAIRPNHWHCLVTIECDGQVQGIMAVESLLRSSRLTENASVLYVDYVEKAPWNFRVPQDRVKQAVRLPRFTGVGTLLIAEAIRMSVGRTAGGRVGLHALSQAESFYVGQCGMNALGPDPNYYGLRYFEYAEGAASDWLSRVRLSA